MTQDEMIELAFTRLPVVPIEERDGVERHMRYNLNRGFSLDDAIKLAYYSEEVSPHFEEEFALRKMSEIYHAERNAYIVKHLPGFEPKQQAEPVTVIDNRGLYE